MTKERIDLTRRKVLGGLTAVGAGALAGGAGSTSYFSDEETFKSNRLMAGDLDVKVDWEEHYSDWLGDETAYAEMAPPDPAAADLYLPPGHPDGQPISLNFVDPDDSDNVSGKDLFWRATSVEAFPDGLGETQQDGRQDDLGDRDACEVLPDVGSGSAGLDADLRTNGTFAGQTTEPGDPLVMLEDVKPGDFGEVTFSFHLCSNPGYAWMNAANVTYSENGVNEPEGKDPDEVEGTVELADDLRVRLWYDPDCDNQLGQTDTVDVMMAVDESISQTEQEQTALRQGLLNFVDGLPSDSQVGILAFGGGEIREFQGLDDPGSLDLTGIADGSGGGNTPLPPAIDIADQEVRNGPNQRDDANKVVVVFTDGGPNYGNQNYTAGGYSAPAGPDYTLDDTTPGYDGGGGGSDAVGRPGGISDSELQETAITAEQVRDNGTRIVTVAVIGDDADPDPDVDTRAYLRSQIASAQAYATDATLADLGAVANDLTAVTMAEDLFFDGSLREAMHALSSGHGIPLDGDPSSGFNEFSASLNDIDGDGDDEFEADDSDPDRDCFAGAGTIHCIGLQWWLPLDHGNEVQTDSVAFDVGFYVEQCRHNSGVGMPPESPST